jgi:hypothetical protein
VKNTNKGGKPALEMYAAWRLRMASSHVQHSSLIKIKKIVAVFSSETDHIAPDEHVKKSLAIVKGL